MNHEPHRKADSHEERQLIRRFLENADESAFRLLYRRHSPSLNAFLLRLLAWDRAGVEEALQEIWIKAVQGLPGFRWESNLRTWLKGIAVNHCRSLWRRRDRERRVAPANPQAPEASIESVEIIDLERAIAQLPTGYRAVLVLHDLEGYTHQQIGRRLGIEVGTSKSQLARARAVLRSKMTAEGDAA